MSLRTLVLALCFALPFGLAACGPRTSAPPQDKTAGFTVTAPRFGDGHPVDWNGNPPSSHPVHGVDISTWQGEVDWRLARANGVNFTYLKATEGGDLVDPAFLHNWHTTAAAGVPHGAYHFFYHCRSAAEQARWFIAHVPKQARALPPVLDMEWTPLSPTCRDRRPASVIRAEARTFLSAVQAAYGQRPILYTTVDFYRENQLWLMSGVDFWLRSVAAHPSDSFPGQHWLFWQYSSTGQVPGIAGPADLDVFSGTKAEFVDWLARQGR